MKKFKVAFYVRDMDLGEAEHMDGANDWKQIMLEVEPIQLRSSAALCG
jgi:hypothetical protein